MNILPGSKVVVTGGAGFIGSHLIHGLLKAGVKEIISLDSLEYGSYDTAIKEDHRVRIVQFAIGTDSIEKLEPIVTGSDFLIHLAAQKHNQSLGTPHAVYTTNIIGTADLYELTGRLGIKKIIFTSSLYAYGSVSLPPMRESDIPRPHTIYGISKLAGEELLEFYGKKFSFDYISLRLFFTYGPRQFPGMGYKSVIVKNFERLSKGEAATICGDGAQSLDYVYVDDVVRAILLSCTSKISGEILNVGTGTSLSIRELTDEMLLIAGKDERSIEFIEPDSTAGTTRISNSSKIKELFGWEPEVSLQDGLQCTYDWVTARI